MSETKPDAANYAEGGVVSESYIRTEEEGSICPVPKASVTFEWQKLTFDAEDSEKLRQLLDEHVRKAVDK